MSSSDSEETTRPVSIILSFVIGVPFRTDSPIKEGPLPASDTAIEALPVVKIDEGGCECCICLDEFCVGGEAKEMICKHIFHSGCLDKWLRVNGSCPVCRFKMPVDEEGERERKVEEERREMRIRFVDGQMVIDYVNS